MYAVSWSHNLSGISLLLRRINRPTLTCTLANMVKLYESSKIAKDYAKFRPVYTKELAECVMEFCREGKNTSEKLDLVIDVGCGSGQSSSMFQPYSKKVVATDISKEQVRQGQLKNIHDNIEFKEGSEKNIPADDNSADLIVSGAAAHWFSLDEFFKEVKRVLKPDGCLAIFGYWAPKINPLISYAGNEDNSQKISDIYEKAVLDSVIDEPAKTAAYKLLQRRYEDIFQAIPFPRKQRIDGIHLVQESSVEYFKGYMKSSDSYQPYIDKIIKNLKCGDQEITQEEIDALDYVEIFLKELNFLFNLDETADTKTLRLDYEFFLLLAK